MKAFALTLSLLSTASFSSAAGAEDPRVTRVAQFFEALHREGRFNGVVLIEERGKVLFQKPYGYADYDTKRPLRMTSAFDLASISKSFTAMAVALLVDQRLVDLDAPLATYLPELPYKELTVRQVLQHTSGLPRYELLFDENGAGGRDVTNEDILAALASKRPPLLFASGAKWEYSNTGYALLASLVTRMSKQPFPVFLKQRLFHPLGLRHTLISRLSSPATSSDEAHGFQKTSFLHDRYGRSEHLPELKPILRIQGEVLGDAGVHATAGDLARWARVLDRRRLVKASTLAQILAPARLKDGSEAKADVGSPHPASYGFGWLLRLDAPGVAWHTGGSPGFMTYLERDRAHDRTIVVLDNGHHATTYRAGEAIDDLLAGRPVAPMKLPIEEVLAPLLRTQSGAAVAGRYRELKATASETYRFRTASLNLLGYELLGENRVEDAIALFRLNTEAYPEDANTFDSLGEAYEKHGDRDLAIASYEMSLKLDPTNDNASKQLEQLRAGR